MNKMMKTLPAAVLAAILGFGTIHSANAAPGDLDTTFDHSGKVTTDFGGGDVGEGVAVQDDGKQSGH